MTIAYFPQERIIFQGDFSVNPAQGGGMQPANDHVRALVPALEKLGLSNYARYINVHASAAPQTKADVDGSDERCAIAIGSCYDTGSVADSRRALFHSWTGARSAELLFKRAKTRRLGEPPQLRKMQACPHECVALVASAFERRERRIVLA